MRGRGFVHSVQQALVHGDIDSSISTNDWNVVQRGSPDRIDIAGSGSGMDAEFGVKSVASRESLIRYIHCKALSLWNCPGQMINVDSRIHVTVL